MTITPDHWLDSATREPIPGGAVMEIRRFLVVHYTAGASAMSSINYWRKLDNGVCAHFVIERDGTIIQCRPCNRTAGHAGASKWSHAGNIFYGLNSCSIGIELANGGDTYPQKFSKLKPTVAKHKHGGPMTEWETYPPEQIEACHRLAAVLCDRYKLDAIVGHDDISPGRKTDPGPAADEFMATMRKDCGFPG